MKQLLVCLFLSVIVTEQAFAKVPEQPVSAKLIRDTETIAPDSVVHVGVLFSIKPGWHIYYQNPGETGLGTEIQLTAENETSIGDIVWPTPVRFVGAGDVYGYGYSKEALLKIPVQIATSARTGKELRFAASVRWLACSDTICLPGKADLKHPAMIGQLRKNVGADVFKAWKGRYSKNLNEIKVIKTLDTEGKKTGDRISLSLVVSWSEAIRDPLWIPDGVDGVLFAEQERKQEGLSDTLSIQAKPVPGSGFSEGVIRGILTFKTTDNRLQSTPVWFNLR